MTENEVFEHISDLAGDYKCFDEKISHQESLILCNLIKEIQQYRAIGTVEGYERAIQSSIENYNLYKEYKAKVQEFEAIGTIEEFKALKEKSVAKKPILSKSMMTKREFQICPVCERLVLYDGIKFNYCQYCGQKLDWQ